ncbi:type I CRISPR-associated protein Cas7, partial [bacterium]|nr:type I CRISPR-associated protein Cas7 [bacterium]
DRDKIKKMDKAEFQRIFWDARVFGNTFLESMKDEKDLKDKNIDHFISTGVIQIGVGLSVAPIDIEMMTLTNKSGVEEGKDRGMAPLAFRVVRHGIYTIPFYVNPSIALKTGATQKDLDLFKFMLPYSYQHTSSAIRPQVSVLHAWFAEHKNPLGSCPEYQFINTLTPSIKKDKEDVESSNSMGDYDIPKKKDIPETISERFLSIEDLLDKSWS